MASSIRRQGVKADIAPLPNARRDLRPTLQLFARICSRIGKLSIRQLEGFCDPTRRNSSGNVGQIGHMIPTSGSPGTAGDLGLHFFGLITDR
jgi:hypothetical protein